MKRYKNIDLDYGVNTALMEAYSAMLAEEDEFEEFEGDNDESIVYGEEVYEVDGLAAEKEEEVVVEEPAGFPSEIFEFEE